MPIDKTINQLDFVTNIAVSNNILPIVDVSGFTPTTKKIAVSSLTYALGITNAMSGVSASWNSTYTTLNTISSGLLSAINVVQTNSAFWDSTYTSVYTTSANWDSTYTTVRNNSADFSVISYDSNTNLLTISSALVDITESLSARSFLTEAISSRNISIVHRPINDGINPFLFIGETSVNQSSGFRLEYNEIPNNLNLFYTAETSSLTALTITPRGEMTAFGLINALSSIVMSSGFISTSSCTISSNSDIPGLTVIGNLSTNGTLSATRLIVGRGSTNSSPFRVLSGTVMTTPSPGAIERNEYNLYFTPGRNAARAIIPASYYYRTRFNNTLPNSTGAHAWLGAGVTILGGTAYEFEGEWNFNTPGTTSHTESLSWAGTSVLNYMHYRINRITTGIAASQTVYSLWAASSATVIMTPAITTAQTATYSIRGTLDCATGGTLIPQLAYSAATGATTTILSGAWFRITPLGAIAAPSPANIGIGTWVV